MWHAQTLLREFRGDGHIAALMIEGVSGIEALIMHSATGAVPAETLRTMRAWSEEEWAAAVAGLQERGLLEPGDDIVFSETGRAQRQWVEDKTDDSGASNLQILIRERDQLKQRLREVEALIKKHAKE